MTKRRDDVTFSRASWILLLMATMVATSTASATEEFTVVLLPDTQFYSQNEPSWYTAQTQWIRDNVETENIKFVIHLGDIVNTASSTTQWQNASASQSILEGVYPIPHSVMPGNHDMIVSTAGVRDATNYNAYFPRSRYENQPWFGDTYGTTNENNYSFFSVDVPGSENDLDFMVLCLEPFPSDSAIAWANAVVNAYPDHRVILNTHLYLNPDGNRRVETTYGNFQGNDGNDVYNKLVKNHPNIFMVNCGHISYEALSVSDNVAGGQVYEILSDYQRPDDENNWLYGYGWLRTLRFVPDENRITVNAYTPVHGLTNGYYDGFTIEYDMGGTVAPAASHPAAVLRSSWSFSGNANDLVGLKDFTLGSYATFTAGRFGDGLALNGTADGDAVADGGLGLSITDAFSGAAWVKYDSANTPFARILSLVDDGNNACNVVFAEGDATSSPIVVRVVKDGIAYHVITEEEVDRNVFHHIAFAFDDNGGPTARMKLQVWIDGVEATLGEANHRDGLRGDEGDFILGRTDDAVIDQKYKFTSEFFSGVIDELRWYDGVLTDEQVAALLLPTPGDATLDGLVNAADARVLAANWLQATSPYTNGDFNGDGMVDDLDASILAANWSSTAESVGVPEPGSLVLLIGIVLLGMSCWKRSRVGR